MSQNSINNRPDEEALAVLLIIAALGFGSLYALAKKAAKRLAGSTHKEDERVGKNEQVDQAPEVPSKQVHVESDVDAQIPTAKERDTTNLREPRLLKCVQADVQLARNQGLNAIHAWEEAMNGRNPRERLRGLEDRSSIR